MVPSVVQVGSSRNTDLQRFESAKTAELQSLNTLNAPFNAVHSGNEDVKKALYSGSKELSNSTLIGTMNKQNEIEMMR